MLLSLHFEIEGTLPFRAELGRYDFSAKIQAEI